MISYLDKKKVLFVTTKNLDYIRNTQEIGMIEKYALSYSIIGSYSNSYPLRILYVFLKMLATHMLQYDTVFIGFAPQLVVPFFPMEA